MRQAEFKAVMVDTGVNLETNAGNVNVPDATEKMAITCTPTQSRTEEETCEEALLWIHEMMAGMEFLIAQTTALVRESAN